MSGAYILNSMERSQNKLVSSSVRSLSTNSTLPADPLEASTVDWGFISGYLTETEAPTIPSPSTALSESELLSLPATSFAPSTSPSPSMSSSPNPSPMDNHSVSELPSQLYSRIPTMSSMPSIAPSKDPTPPPSMLPSVTQSPSMSESPTNVASQHPSGIPSWLPSLFPSTEPSIAPSAFPSTLPTLECHDYANYRSPINNLTCDDHRDTDCTSWRHVMGGNLTELKDLVTSCPQTCQIPCGSFKLVEDVTLSFIISGLPGLLDVTTQAPLEEVALSYLATFVQTNTPNNHTFILDSVALKSQEPLLRRRLRQRSLQDDYTNLRVAISLFGFSIGMEDGTINSLLLLGIDNDEFTNELRASSRFFANALATSAVREFPQAIDLVDPNESSPPDSYTSIIVISMLGTCALLAFGVGFYVFYVRNKQLELDHPSSIHPIQVHPLSPSISVQSSSLFSFSQQSPATTPRAQELYGFSSGQGKILGSLSRSKDSEDDPAYRDVHFKTNPSTKLDAAVFEEPHPLALVIPPMIVYNEIDGTDNQNNVAHGTARIVPSRHLKASPSFSMAISADQPPPNMDPMMPDYAPFSQKSSTCGESGVDIHLFAQKASSSSDDSSVEGVHELPRTANSGSIASTPVLKSDRGLAGFTLQRSLSGNAAEKSASSDIARMGFPSPNVAFSLRNNSVSQKRSPSPSSIEISPKVTGSNIVGRTVPSPLVNGTMHRRETPSGSSSPSLRETIHSPFSPHHRISSPGNECSLLTTETVHFLAAPTECKLGVTIESSRNGSGSTIHTVKEYSPLLGLIFEGDRILSVDSRDTSAMNSGEVSGLLARRRHSKGTINISVARRIKVANDLSPLPVEFVAGDHDEEGNVEVSPLDGGLKFFGNNYCGAEPGKGASSSLPPS